MEILANIGNALRMAFAMFQATCWNPRPRNTQIVEATVSLNYTTILNVIFLILAALLLIRFFRTGGPEMLRMMNRTPHQHQQ